VAKVAALGDAHLGRSYLNRTTPEGLNQREVDFELSFERAVDAALAESPDLVVWLGDVFDHPRPTYRSFRLAQRALGRIRDHGVPVVVISGNHDTPRLPGTGSPYSALADTFSSSDMHFAHRLAYQRFEVAGLVVHAVPQMLTADATLAALAEADRARDLDRVNLLLTHPRIPQLQPKHADINEIEVDAGALRSDLVLLGHYHFHVEVGQGVWYAGSTDTFTFADNPESAKGIVVLDTDSGSCRHVPLDGQRPLVTLEPVVALGLSPAEVEAAVLARAEAVPQGAVARLYVDQVDPEAWRLLDLEAVRSAAAAALDLRLHPTFGVGVTADAVPDLGSVPAQWDRFLDNQDLTGFDRPLVARMGHDYLARAVDEAVD
jgi:DNA repair exonuclease SbcCD nuclease subunit